MVAPAIPLVYWGYAILFAGGATIAARRLLEEDEIGRIELPDSIAEVLEGRPQPEPEPERERPKPFPVPYDEGTEKKARQRCEDDPEQDCQMCKALSEGRDVKHSFAGGEVRKPSPKARGALYQHFVVPWFSFVAEEVGGELQIKIGEWEWKLGKKQSWDGLVFSECKLLECKLGYRDFIDPERVGDGDAYLFPNPEKPDFLTIGRMFSRQLLQQYSAFIPDWPSVQLEWIFSDTEVMWQFVNLRSSLGFHEVGNRHVAYDLAPSGTEFLRDTYAKDTEGTYGYWED